MKNETYEQFVQKFEPKKTTDDCYTPPEVYDAVLRYCIEQNLINEQTQIVRPFYPGGDYTAVDYEGKVVIDNPPFSIISKIVKYYSERNVQYFLFCPGLVGFPLAFYGGTFIAPGVQVRYENGAVVNTGFVTNLIANKVIAMTAPELGSAIKNAQRPREIKEKTVINLPRDYFTAARLGTVAKHGGHLQILREHATLERKTPDGIQIFGAAIKGEAVWLDENQS